MKLNVKKFYKNTKDPKVAMYINYYVDKAEGGTLWNVDWYVRGEDGKLSLLDKKQEFFLIKGGEVDWEQEK